MAQSTQSGKQVGQVGDKLKSKSHGPGHRSKWETSGGQVGDKLKSHSPEHQSGKHVGDKWETS